jgi:hypothetical protein
MLHKAEITAKQKNKTPAVLGSDLACTSIKKPRVGWAELPRLLTAASAGCD